MGSVLLVLLVIAWGVLLIPKLLQRGDGRFGIPNPLAFLAGLSGSRQRRSSRVVGRNDPFGRSHQVARSTNVMGAYQNTRYPTSAAARVRRSAKRRRDVLFGLMASAIGTALLALIPSFSMLWSAHIIVDVLLFAYVGLLVASRNNARAGQRAPQQAMQHAMQQAPGHAQHAMAYPMGGVGQPGGQAIDYAYTEHQPASPFSAPSFSSPRPRRSTAAFFDVEASELSLAYARAANE